MRRAFPLAVMMFAQPAFAGDLLADPGADDPAEWSGAYAGAFGGPGASPGHARLHDYSGSLIPADVAYGLFPAGIRHNTISGAAGVAAGINVQSGAFVAGVEADIGYAWTRARHAYSRIDNVPGSPFPGVSTNTSYATDFGALGTLRLRGGHAFGGTLLYATAGLAVGHVGNRLGLALPEIGYASPDWSGSGFRVGYAIGGGIEQRLTGSVSVKLEALYIDLADRVVQGADPAAFPGESIGYKFTNDVVMPRLGINMRF